MKRFALTICLACACVPTPSDGEDPSGLPGEGITLDDGTVFTRAALLRAFSQCIVAEQEQFATLAQTLSTTTTAALTDATNRAEAQAAWRAAIARWQVLEVMQIGPTGLSTTPGGDALRDGIYAWPVINACGVDKLLVDEGYAQPSFAAALVDVKGLGALEIALFDEGADNACDATAAINIDGTWNALSAEQRQQRRAAFAAVVAADTAQKAQAIVTSWTSSGKNYQAEFDSAGNGSRLFRRAQLALNVVSDAMFYIEYGDKDGKLGKPLGLTQCDAERCLDAVESPNAGLSTRHIHDNLIGLRKLFNGCDDGAGLGFDDFLIAVGSRDLATRMTADIDAALAAANAIEEDDLATAITADVASVTALHTAIKAITDDLRTEFVSILDFEIPKRVEGDND